MIVSEGRLGRIFVLRLGDGDRIPDAIEDFAAARGIGAALVAALGGLENGRLVVGPEDDAQKPPRTLTAVIDAVHEAVAVGTLFPGPDGRPSLHLHASLGRGETARTGCARPGLDVWTVLEVVILEIEGLDLARLPDPATGLNLLGQKAGPAA